MLITERLDKNRIVSKRNARGVSNEENDYCRVGANIGKRPFSFDKSVGAGCAKSSPTKASD